MMNLKRYLYASAMIAMLAMLAACKDNNEPVIDDEEEVETKEPTATQKWIESTMREHYLWYDEIPTKSRLDYTLDDNAFFTSMLSTKDGRMYDGKHYPFSYMEKVNKTRNFIQADYSYGFEYIGFYVNDGANLVAVVLYVLDQSPADEAGLKRGDWVLKKNDKLMTESDFATLPGGAACTFTIGHYDPNSGFAQDKDISMPAARAVDDNPVYYSDVITSATGKKVAYLVYNEFEEGIANDDVEYKDRDTSYDDLLRKLSAEKFADVDEFVLDLRYNNGGLLSSAILLCSIFQPSDYLGQDLGYLEYNTKQTPRKFRFITDTETYLKTGKNLNLKRLFVLTSTDTASASEMIINCLNPMMEVVVIGEQTVGKNVGSEEYKDDDNTWKMHPIVCKLTNIKDWGDYNNGFTPHVTVNEIYDLTSDGKADIQTMLPLGDPQERLLRVALGMIDGSSTTRSTPATVGTPVDLKPVFRSISRKSTPGVVVRH
ncbi:MAG: peptidase S41 [Mediterranea sp.]|jgi:C-terminal processing protease CtpA/Prc|nr:peptidase S41 [Mediterranea sp.]